MPPRPLPRAVPEDCEHSGLYYVLMPSHAERTAMLEALRERGVLSVFHYVPLHSSPAGQRLGRTSGSLAVTDDASARLLRLPIWPGMEDADVDYVVDSFHAALREVTGATGLARGCWRRRPSGSSSPAASSPRSR